MLFRNILITSVAGLMGHKLRPCQWTNCEAPEAEEKMTHKMQFWHSLFQYYRHFSIKDNKYNFEKSKIASTDFWVIQNFREESPSRLHA